MSEALKPWTVRKNIHAEGTAYVCDGDRREIAFCQTIADAERIAAAWNTRPTEDALVAALKVLLEGHCCDDGSADYKYSPDGCPDCKQARAALKQAGAL